ncbi:hypothetical protein CHARACLAT_006189 [Characodon lateralis]|uniref:Uncharacterized protein n=1 Tax=Characodon lateralis TaxID=208331 RepID=A0ABU7E8R3_9TELE|nr:hypothetical protein [Characodon lateralis]
MLKQTAWCSSKRSMWHSTSRSRCSTRFRERVQSSTPLEIPSASSQTDPKMSRDSVQSSRIQPSNSIWSITMFGVLHVGLNKPVYSEEDCSTPGFLCSSICFDL